MRSRYSSGRLQEAWRMLERAVTETTTVSSKLADTREPLQVITTPVVLKVPWSRMLGDKVRKKPALVPVGPSLGGNERSRSRGTLEAALGCPAGAFSSGPQTKLPGYPSRPQHPLLPGA